MRVEVYHLLRHRRLVKVQQLLHTGFCQKADMFETLNASEEMKRYGIPPDVYSYSILIDGFCKKGGVVDISQDMLYNLVNNSFEYLRFLEEMVGSNSTSSATAADFYTLIQGFSKIGLFDMALEAFKSCSNVSLAGCVGKEKAKKALQLFPLMFKRNVFAEVEIYSTLMDGFSSIKKEEAVEMYNEMFGKSYRGNAVTYTFLIDGYCKVKRMDIAIKYFDEMQRNSIAPDAATYNALMSGHTVDGSDFKDPGEAEAAQRSLTEANLKAESSR
ncbi:pentatricopeptide repeat-containing protein At2g01740-like [Ziziphus jujuba]|uniref:Pentatricopeptide repeat-containing protein At2g01740-like n=1 Tax=Ziziphus jujuba TaxID=326968 RepID=A0ABM4A2K1_ZIZJJ|nr:pentatricopeptide repeat-containing protein At2g01740-like [Ziziphus jujuba]